MFWICQSCDSNPEFGQVPEIEFLGLSKDTLVQNFAFTDSLFLSINFKDGDGDLGTETSNISQNIILTDSRTGERFEQYKIPKLPIGGGQTGIEGSITMKVYTTCCIFPDGTPPCLNPPEFPVDELKLSIQMTDDSGNQSNIVETSFITLLCN